MQNKNLTVLQQEQRKTRMKINWIMDAMLPEEILLCMQRAADQSTECEGIEYPCSLSVRLCSDEVIAEINRHFRNKAQSTDVLSFPSVSYPAGKTAGSCGKLLRLEYDDETGTCFLGDIIIAVPHIYAQAQEYGHTVSREAAYLLTHGICHLFGYDHMEEDDKKRMRLMEEKILSSAYIRD